MTMRKKRRTRIGWRKEAAIEEEEEKEEEDEEYKEEISEDGSVVCINAL